MYALVWSGIVLARGDDQLELGRLGDEVSARHPHIAPARLEVRA